MGEIIVRKVKSMNWKAKLSLVLIFTLVFSTFMYQGWYRPKGARSAITMSAWTTIYSNTGYPNAASVAYSVPAGSNRLLVVTISSTRSSTGTQTYTVSYGGQTLTRVTGDETISIQQHTAIYYLNEVGIAAATNGNFTLTISGGTSRLNILYATTLTGVDQTNPITDSQNYNSGTGTTTGPAFATALTENANDQPIVILNATRTGTTTASNATAATNWVLPASGSAGNSTLSNIGSTMAMRAAALDRNIPTSNTSDTAPATLGNSSLASMSGMSLKMAVQVNVAGGTNPANATVYANDTNKTIDGFTMTANGGTPQVTALTVTVTNPANLSSIRLYRDTGTTVGSYDAGDTLLATVASPTASVTFSGLTETPATTGTNYIIVGDIAGGATVGQTITAVAASLTVAAPDTQGTVTDSSATLTVGTGNLTVGNGTNPANANVQQASTGKAIDSFTTALSVSTGTISSLTLTTSAQFTTANVASIKVYHDAGTIGTLDGADTLVPTTYSIGASTATITFTTPENVTTTTANYLIVVDIATGATVGNTLTARVTAAAGTGLGTATYSDTASATLTITAGTCTAAAPTVSLSPTSGGALASGSAVYNVSITNNDSAFCGATTFAIGKTDTPVVPTADFASSTLSSTSTGALSPGASYSTATVTVTATASPTIGNALQTYITATGAGHTATNSSTVTTTIIDASQTSPLMHNSNNLGNQGWPNGWGVTGGQYGAFSCTTCHTKTTTNIKRIKTSITTPDSSNWPNSSPTTNAISFTTANVVSNTSDMGDTVTPFNGICNVCHDPTKHKHYSYSGSDGHNAGVDCGKCHMHSQAFKGSGKCLDCHSSAQGVRPAIVPLFSENSHHVQGVAVSNTDCYACHWEANPDGSINTTYHPTAAGYPVQLVVWSSTTRPTTYTLGTTAVQYTGASTRTATGGAGGIDVINQFCLGCHSDGSKAATPFSDGKNPNTYAWDGTCSNTAYNNNQTGCTTNGGTWTPGTSIGARYTQTGTTTWGKYTNSATAPGVASKVSTKAYSAHGDAAANTMGWDTTNGVDGTITDRTGSVNVDCFDCHNSHGSNAGDATHATTSYASATTTGGILKNTTNGVGGYTVAYTPTAAGTAGTNSYNPGAAICFDCHLSSTTTSTPWAYTTFGATGQILGYFDAPYFGNGLNGPMQRYAFKNNKQTSQHGHFGVSSALQEANAPASTTINGLCTPCHDPHGVSTTLGANQAYAVPLLKGTWLTSPYKEDAPPATTNLTVGNGDQSAARAGYSVASTPGYFIDQNTFAGVLSTSKTGIPQWNFTSTAGVTETDTQFAGLCLNCHAKANIAPNAGSATAPAWGTYARIHNTVKGWRGTYEVNPKHNYVCSKCHAPHDSGLPRLLVTNCLDYNHRGRVATGGAAASQSGSDGQGRFPAGGGGSSNGTGFGCLYGANEWGCVSLGGANFFGNKPTNQGTRPAFANCHDAAPGNTGTWPSWEHWNTKSPW